MTDNNWDLLFTTCAGLGRVRQAAHVSGRVSISQPFEKAIDGWILGSEQFADGVRAMRRGILRQTAALLVESMHKSLALGEIRYETCPRHL